MAKKDLNKILFLEFDTTHLTPPQIRLIKTLNHMIQHVLTTENESEYFDSSAELVRMCASLIKQARFIQGMESEDIPYSQQVLEYSIDVLQDHMNASKVVTYDN